MFNTLLRVDLPRFQRQRLDVTAPLIGRPVLLLNGQRVRLRLGRGQVIDDQGATVVVTVRRRQPDPFPVLMVDGLKVLFGQPLRWYERLWLGLPVLMLFGGPVGLGLGLIAVLINGRLFRSSFSLPFRYLATLLVVVIAVAVGADLLWALRSWVQAHPAA